MMTGSEYSTDASVSPEVLYRYYRETRLTDHGTDHARTSHIDAIMAVLEDQRSESAVSTRQAPEIHSVSSGTSIVTLPMRIAGVAVAATLAAVLIFPKMLSMIDNVDSISMTVAAVPESLTLEADTVMPFIDQNKGTVLGFASGASMTTLAFKKGILTTDLALAGSAGLNDSIVELLQTQWLQPLSSSTVGAKDSALAKAGADYVKRWSGSAVGDADSARQLAEILRLLNPSSDNAVLSHWFLQGQSVEAVRIAADLALEHSNTQPLVESLELHKALVLPAEILPGSGLIGSLRDRSLTEPVTVADIRWVLATTENILAVMQ